MHHFLVLVVGTFLSLAGSLRGVTRSGQCESVPSVKVPAHGFLLSGPIYQLVPDRLPSSPFVVFANHTQYGSCLKVHLTWMPRYSNITLVCACAGSHRQPALQPAIQPGLDPEATTRWSNIQLVFAQPDRFAIVYGCYDHGNGFVSEGAIALGRTLRTFDVYQNPQQAMIFSPFFPFHRRLHETMVQFAMNHSTELVCNFWREFYLHRGPTGSDIAFVIVATIIVVTLTVSVCRLFRPPRLHGLCGQ
uniref:Uncharacterized protein n=1 Tax=Anopheles atroparvus TaxID=41427 RepID=A0A182JDU1_ANOAO